MDFFKLGVKELKKKFEMLSVSSKGPLLTIHGSVEEIQKDFFPGNVSMEVNVSLPLPHVLTYATIVHNFHNKCYARA